MPPIRFDRGISWLSMNWGPTRTPGLRAPRRGHRSCALDVLPVDDGEGALGVGDASHEGVEVVALVDVGIKWHVDVGLVL